MPGLISSIPLLWMLACSGVAHHESAIGIADRAVKVGQNMAGPIDQSVLATSSQPASIELDKGSRPPASGDSLELTVRPIELDPDVPFLVQVYATEGKNSGPSYGGPELLGSFSFFQAQAGQTQKFVVDAPDLSNRWAGDQNVAIELKLIPANPERRLDKSTIELLGARIVE